MADSEHAEFVRRARAADLRTLLAYPDLPRNVIDLLLAAKVPDAASLLERQAAAGDASSNVILLRLWHFCVDRSDTESQVEAPREPPPEYPAALRAACEQATFEKERIQSRLQDAANAGHAASLFVLGADSGDPLARRRYWMSAAMLGDLQAQLELIDLLTREEFESGRKTGGANFWMAVAANESPRARTSLAFCRLTACDQQGADPAAATRLVREAAQKGDEAALALLSIAGPGGWGDDPSPDFEVDADERYAWTLFQKRLRDRGCYGAAEFERRNRGNARLIANMEREISPSAKQSGEKLAASYWRQYSAAAIDAQRCE